MTEGIIITFAEFSRDIHQLNQAGKLGGDNTCVMVPSPAAAVELERSGIPRVSPTYYGCTVRLFDASTKKFARNA